MRSIRVITIFGLCFIIFFWIGSILFTPTTWAGTYYPNGCLACSNDYIFSPEYSTKEECLESALSLYRLRNNPNDEYECGKNCRPLENAYRVYICDETVDY